jgi:hypothetical protein
MDAFPLLVALLIAVALGLATYLTMLNLLA